MADRRDGMVPGGEATQSGARTGKRWTPKDADFATTEQSKRATGSSPKLDMYRTKVRTVLSLLFGFEMRHGPTGHLLCTCNAVGATCMGQTEFGTQPYLPIYGYPFS